MQDKKIPFLITQLPVSIRLTDSSTLNEKKNKLNVGVFDSQAEKVAAASTINRRREKKNFFLAPITLKMTCTF